MKVIKLLDKGTHANYAALQLPFNVTKGFTLSCGSRNKLQLTCLRQIQIAFAINPITIRASLFYHILKVVNSFEHKQ